MALGSVTNLSDFGYLFSDLQEDPESLLPRRRETVAALDRLGGFMREPGTGETLNSSIPAAYTYFGQFVDHDIVLETRSDQIANVASPDLEPLLLQQALLELKNTRSAALDLDSVYGHPALRQGAKLRLGEVSRFIAADLEDRFHDLFRQGRMPDEPEHDREALIGDHRNDENLIVAQLHVAFLRAHNELVDRGLTFDEARATLRQHYQWIVIHDFLPRIAQPSVVQETLAGSRFYQPWSRPFFLPLEFTAAAFRFGHSMIRSIYRHNSTFPKATLAKIFTFSALSGNFDPLSEPNFPPAPPGGFDTLPDAWIIDWSGFVDALRNPARKIDTLLVDPLLELRDVTGQVRRIEPRLAVRNLRRGYLLRMPTGQAVARRIGLDPLTTEQLKRGMTPAQQDVLAEGGLLERTPLWFYILAEAAQGGGDRLGPVGSRLVAEVLIGLVRRSSDSILAGNGRWTPSLGAVPGQFNLDDLLRLAKVLPVQPDTPS